MDERAQQVLITTAQKDAVGQVMRQNLELEEENQRLKSSNKWLRKQLAALMLKLEIMEQGEEL